MPYKNLERMYKIMSNNTNLSNLSERELFERIKAGDEAARDELIASLVPMVKSMVYEATSKIDLNGAVSREDLEQDAFLALTSAVDNFTPGTARFSSYAHFYVRGTILSALRNETLQKVGKVTVSTFNQYCKANACRKKLQRAGLNSSPEAVAAKLNMPLSTVVEAFIYMDSSACPVSLSADRSNEASSYVSVAQAKLAELSRTTEDEVVDSCGGDFLDDIKTLTDTEKTAFRLYEGQGLTLEEVGEQLGMTESGARKAVIRARNKARAAFGLYPDLAA